MELGLKGRVALVAAGSKGLGRACALALAREGADVAICARGEEALRATEKEIARAGVRAHGVVADLAAEEGCRRFVEESVEALGGVHVLVNNAGGPPPGPTDAFDDEGYLRALELNVFSTIRCTRLVLPRMRAQRWGRIVNITSHAAKEPIVGLALSNVSRPAVHGFAKTLATEVAAEGITVNTVLPGTILTDRVRALSGGNEDTLRAAAARIPAGRLGEPPELGALVAFLASEQASYITGTTIPVDGGSLHGLI